jgi:hypothetical protein
MSRRLGPACTQIKLHLLIFRWTGVLQPSPAGADFYIGIRGVQNDGSLEISERRLPQFIKVVYESTRAYCLLSNI